MSEVTKKSEKMTTCQARCSFSKSDSSYVSSMQQILRALCTSLYSQNKTERLIEMLPHLKNSHLDFCSSSPSSCHHASRAACTFDPCTHTAAYKSTFLNIWYKIQILDRQLCSCGSLVASGQAEKVVVWQLHKFSYSHSVPECGFEGRK